MATLRKPRNNYSAEALDLPDLVDAVLNGVTLAGANMIGASGPTCAEPTCAMRGSW